MTYLFSSNVEVSNDQGNALPVSGNIGVLNGGSIVTLLNPLPVTIGSDTINIVGNITIPTIVQVYSNVGQPMHNHITEVGTTDLLAANIGYIPIGGNVEISNDVGNPIPISATTATNSALNPIYITGAVTTVGGSAQGKLWTVQVAQGLVAGHSTVQVTGYNPTTSAGDAIWTGGTAYPWSSLTTAQTLYLKSSTNNATDRSMPILITGLDSNYHEQSEVVTLNASDSRTPVTSTKQFLRIHGVTCNGTDTNVGDVTVHVTSGTGTVVSKLSAGRGTARSGVYTVPAGYTGYLWKGDASSTAATVVNFMVRYYGKAFLVAHVAVVDNSTYVYDFPFPIALPEKTDLYCVVEAGSGKTAVNYEIMLIANP
jgi:hypothetical protein